MLKLPLSVFRSKPRLRAFVELLLAIASEQVGTSAMKASQGFSLPLPTLLAVVGYLSSLFGKKGVSYGFCGIICLENFTTKMRVNR